MEEGLDQAFRVLDYHFDNFGDGTYTIAEAPGFLIWFVEDRVHWLTSRGVAHQCIYRYLEPPEVANEIIKTIEATQTYVAHRKIQRQHTQAQINRILSECQGIWPYVSGSINEHGEAVFTITNLSREQLLSCLSPLDPSNSLARSSKS